MQDKILQLKINNKLQEQEDAAQFDMQDWHPKNNMQYFYSLMTRMKPSVEVFITQYAKIITGIHLNLTQNYPHLNVEFVQDVSAAQLLMFRSDYATLGSAAFSNVS